MIYYELIFIGIIYMPIIWRYLLSEYLKVLCLCIVAFIAILLTTRLDEIAHFATLGSDSLYIFLFTLYQIPYILPIAIPISSLISSILLIQRLSSTHELTALRAAGLSFKDILAPILIAASFIAIANFYIVSDTTTHSHLETSILKNRLRSVNPLLIAHNKHLLQMKGLYFDILGPSQLGETASDAILAMPGRKNGNISLMLAKDIQASPLNFNGKGVTLISNRGSHKNQQFDSFMIENLEKTEASSQDFAQMLQKKVWTINNDHLQLAFLRIRIQEDKKMLEEARQQNLPESQIKIIQRKIARNYSEIVRRAAISLSVVTFALMGLAFGVNISRTRSHKGIIILIILASLTMVSFFIAKSLDDRLWASSLLYLVPQCLIILIATAGLNRVSRGLE